ncbi:MAG: UDP-3-O-(3-hydroxymyristoyl)glucosamine N-acyltransferase [Desulfobulbus propionicus]|nr:MAG: UDP-3-O-(3-hydroxymyristoyl)glucosamine N-acyltransferase [Desulfobulbus propionicus]
MTRAYTLKELADHVGGTVIGDEKIEITALNGMELAVPGELTFLLDKKKAASLEKSKASGCIVPFGVELVDMACIAVDQPDVAAARIHMLLLEEPFTATGTHPAATIGENCTIPEQVSIGPHAALGNNVTFGERVVIHPGVVIGNNVTIGDETVLYPNVCIADDSIIGSRVTIHHGAIIGSDGFGFATDTMGNHYSKPQVGNVRIDDDVQVGACSCIDRAAFGTTWIKSGARIDNLVQVAHNVVIGENAVLVAQVGIAGSTTLGRSVLVGGQTAIKGHIQIGDGVMIAARSGVHNNQKPGAVIGGAPAIDAKQWGRAAMAYGRIPDTIKEVRRLRKELDEVKAQLNQSDLKKGEE